MRGKGDDEGSEEEVKKRTGCIKILECSGGTE